MPTQVSLLQLCIELQSYFLNWWIKKSHAKNLTVRHFMIISLFKNCALLQQFYVSIESLK